MSYSRRRFLKRSALGGAGLIATTALPILPAFAVSSDGSVVTISFAGTGCTGDEGEIGRDGSELGIYSSDSGYIPVRINRELKHHPSLTKSGFPKEYRGIVRGVGENMFTPFDTYSLDVDGPIRVLSSMKRNIEKFKDRNKHSTAEQAEGHSMNVLALHGANLAARAIENGAQKVNLIGHSRGACECILAAWMLNVLNTNKTHRKVPVNIFAIDPVPGPGNWPSVLTKLPKNVEHYVGIYSWDEVDGTTHTGRALQAVVPCPNSQMTGEKIVEELTPSRASKAWKRGRFSFDEIANHKSIGSINPLAPNVDRPQPKRYELYACRGKHSTVAGNWTSDGRYKPTDKSEEVEPVPQLIYQIARAYLTSWGTTFKKLTPVSESVLKLRQKIHLDHRQVDNMGGGETRDSSAANRPWVRRVSSIWGRDPFNTYYMDDVVGDPPYTLSYPVTKDRKNKGFVNWKFL